MAPAIDASTLTDENITIQNVNSFDSPTSVSTLESPLRKKARVEKGTWLLFFGIRFVGHQTMHIIF